MKTKIEYSFCARHELIQEPVMGTMHAYDSNEVVTWIINRIIELTGKKKSELNAVNYLKVFKLTN